MTSHGARREAGLTLVEVLLVSVFFAILLVVLSEVMKTVTDTQHRIQAQDYASTASGRAMEQIRSSGLAARNILINDDEGKGYFAALDTTAFPPLPDTRLPLGDPTAKLVPDRGTEILTGNALLLVIEEPPLLVQGTDEILRIDLVRFVAFYLTIRPGKVVDARDDRIDLVQFTSRLYAEKTGIDAVLDAGDRAKAVIELRDRAVDTAWAPGAPVNEAFFDLLEGGGVAVSPSTTPKITADPDGWVMPLMGSSRMSIAGNGEAASVPLFARPVPGADQFPCGFEVKVVGPSSGRRLLTRLVLLIGDPGGHDFAQEAVRVLTLRDF